MRSIIAAILFVLCSPLGALAAEPFGITAPAPDWLQRDWERALHVMDQEMWIVTTCRDRGICTPEARRVLAMAHEAEEAARAFGWKALIALPNRAVNLTLRPHGAHAPRWIRDAWLPALTSLSTERGECKEEVLLKLLVYRIAGIPVEKLRAVYVRLPDHSEAHLVAAVRHEGTWYIADGNTNSVVSDTARHTASRDSRLKLIGGHSLAFSTASTYLHGSP